MGSLALEKLNRRLFFSSSSSTPTSRRSTTDPYEYELLSSPDDSSSTNSLPSYSSPTLSSPPRRTSPPHPSNGRLSPLRRKFQSHSKLRYLSHFCSLGRFAYFILSIPFFLAIGVLWSGIPSNYDSIKEYELRLPQHNNSLPFPEGSDGKYLRFANGIWGHGWNNVLQEVLVHSHLSHALHRSYVFEPYTWSHTFFPWTIYDFALRPAQIPLNAFISGPSAGGDMPHPRSVSKDYWKGVCGKRSDLVRNGERHAIVWVGKGDEVMVEVEIVGASDDDPGLQVPSTLAKNNSSSSSSSPAPPFAPDALRPRSVTIEGARRPPHSSLWPRASKNPSRRVTWGRLPREQEGDVILKWWFDRLSTLEERCIEIRGGPMFDQFLFGSPRILSLWPSLRTSPPITHFSWSPLVQAGVTRNLHRVLPPNDASSISPASLFPPPTPSLFPTLSTALHTSRQQNSQEYNPAPLSSLLALHIRRGDYIRHCPRLARWGATFLGFNSFPSFGSEELFKEPDFLSLGGREEYYRKRCWPSVEEVVRKLRRVREEWEGGSSNTSHHQISQSTRDSSARTLRHLYLMTNGWPSFVSELRHALLADGWETLTSSLDVERGLDSEQKWVAMAVDMAVAERAAVLVGNGFSSLTSNIVMLRMAKGMDPESHHFW